MVFALWADDVQTVDGVSQYLLWAPNVDGSRPWSDAPGGLLVYGERVEGSLPDDKALSVRGADPHTVLTLRVEKRGEEYWASWGGGNRAAS